MAQSVIGALRVNLGLDSAQFQRGTSRAQKSLNNMRNQFMAVTGVVAAFGAAVGLAARRGGDEIDNLVKDARRLDGSANALQALRLAGSEAGVSLSSLTNDVQTMGREIVAGSAPAVEAMQRLGLSADELMAMDVDERVATVADRIKDMGLSAADATGILRDLGVRNREMALLMISGGAAIRAAREDIRDYGLEIDDALGARIEQANDRIGRLGIVSQYLGRRLAAEVVPALGAFAMAITDSMREGGALRGLLDGLVDNMRLLVSIAGVAVTAFGVRYVGALVLATAQTFTFTGALVALRTALIRTGIGALIVGAGMLVDQLVQLRFATGSWGEALSALGSVGNAVVDWIGGDFERLGVDLAAVWQTISAGFFEMLHGMSEGFSTFMSTFTSLSALPSIGPTAPFKALGDAAVAVTGAVNGFSDSADRASLAAEQLRFKARTLASAGADRVRAAFTELSAIIDGNTAGTTEAADAARELAAQLEQVSTGGGGAAAGIDKITEANKELENASRQVEGAFGQAFSSIITGSSSAKDAIGQLLQQLAKMWADSAFQSLFGGAFEGDGFLSFLNPFGGGSGADAMAMPKMSMPAMPAQLAMAAPLSPVMAAPKQNPGKMQIGIGFDESIGAFRATVRDDAGLVVAQAIQTYRREGLPRDMQQISRDPRRIG